MHLNFRRSYFKSHYLTSLLFYSTFTSITKPRLLIVPLSKPRSHYLTVPLRGEVVTSRCQGSKIFEWQQTKTSLKKWIRTVSNLIDLISFHFICQTFAKFSGLNPKGPYVGLEKEKENFCVVLTYSIKPAREIRMFHVAVVKHRLRNVQKSVMHLQICCFANLNPLVFLLFTVAVAKNSLLLSSTNFATIVTWRHTSLALYWVQNVFLLVFVLIRFPKDTANFFNLSSKNFPWPVHPLTTRSPLWGFPSRLNFWTSGDGLHFINSTSPLMSAPLFNEYSKNPSIRT